MGRGEEWVIWKGVVVLGGSRSGMVPGYRRRGRRDPVTTSPVRYDNVDGHHRTVSQPTCAWVWKREEREGEGREGREGRGGEK